MEEKEEEEEVEGGEVRGRGCAGVASLCLPLGAGPYYLQLQPK